jgi:hypothetical protein
MPKGKKGPTPDALDETIEEQAPLEQQPEHRAGLSGKGRGEL